METENDCMEEALRTFEIEADHPFGTDADDWRTFAEALLDWCDEPLTEAEMERDAARFAARAVLLAGGEAD